MQGAACDGVTCDCNLTGRGKRLEHFIARAMVPKNVRPIAFVMTAKYLFAAAAAVALTQSAFAASPAQFRKPTEDVNSPAVRERQELHPNANLLFNGWGLTPAGKHAPLEGDLVLKMLVAPDKKVVVAVNGGYNKHGVTLLDLAAQKVAQHIPLEVAWNGLAFSKDGKRFFVAGGDTGQIHVFKYADGKAELERSVKPSEDVTRVFIAGIAVHPATGALYVCNEANHEVW